MSAPGRGHALLGAPGDIALESRLPHTSALWFLTLLAAVLASACERKPDAAPDKPVVYCSVDEVFARSVFDVFSRRAGVELAVVFDSEAGKTTGLVNKIISEAAVGRPRADVFWSSELFNTILLASRDLLEPYASPAVSDIPPRFKDPQHRWTALAVRARVLAFDPARTARSELPTSWEALAEPRFVKELAFANPLFGTTRGHVAAMFALWGPERGRAFLIALRDGGAQIADGNSATVRAVIGGRAKLAATDSDDVWVAQRGGAALDLIYPDMGDGGTLLIPCSVAIVKGARHADLARKLVDFLVSAEVERMLAESDSRNIPVRESLRGELGIAWPPESKISFDAVAGAMDEAVASAREILIR
jgi:iron(III) transport system substrate-binding protein